MKDLEQQFSKDLVITSSSNSVREYSDSIPCDLLIDIFLRFHVKSIGRFRCVSKLWRSIIRRPDFTELFLTKSNLTCPRIFFAIEDYNKDELSVFSSPQPQDGDCSLVATRYNDFPKYIPTEICPPLRGLVFLYGSGIRRVRVICNPLTGESITLPQMKATGYQKSYFGYDPINKQFKVLCMTYKSRYGIPNTHRILTLGTGKRFWRSTMRCKPYYSLDDTGICINGILFFVEKHRACFDESREMVCFDFRSEKFSFIKMHEDMCIRVKHRIEFANYKGKLCAFYFRDLWNQGDQLVMLVLEDAGQHKWSKSICVMPPFRGASIGKKCYIVGMTGKGEIVFKLYGYSSNDPFYLAFYNIERNTFTSVNIHGLEGFKHNFTCEIFLDYVENMTPM